VEYLLDSSFVVQSNVLRLEISTVEDATEKMTMIKLVWAGANEK